MRVVLDTNILVSDRIAHGNENRVLRLAAAGRFELYLSKVTLDEFASVMPRKFNWDQAQVLQAITEFRQVATVIDPPSSGHALTGHPPDDRILDCVAAAEADFLVTGDRRHLLPLRTFGNARIVTAAEFLEELEASDS